MDSESVLNNLFMDLLSEGFIGDGLKLLEKVKDTYSQYYAWKAVFSYALTVKGGIPIKD